MLAPKCLRSRISIEVAPKSMSLCRDSAGRTAIVRLRRLPPAMHLPGGQQHAQRVETQKSSPATLPWFLSNCKLVRISSRPYEVHFEALCGPGEELLIPTAFQVVLKIFSCVKVDAFAAG